MGQSTVTPATEAPASADPAGAAAPAAPQNPGAPAAAGATPPPAAAPQTPPAINAPWAANDGVYMIGEGEAARPWWDTIPETEVRDYIEAKQYANPAQAAMAAYNANKLNKNMENAIIPPGENATPEDWNNFYNKIGRPESPDGYEFQFAEGVEVNDDMVAFGKELFHELGVRPDKAQIGVDKWNEFNAKMAAKMAEDNQAANSAALAALTQKWEGEGKLEEMRAAGDRVVQALGLSKEAIDALSASAGDATVVELLAVIGANSAEGTFKDTGNPSGDPNDPAGMSPSQAQAKIEALQQDDAFQKKYTDKQNPGNAEAVRLMEALFAKANTKA